jgi:hypothetical protein
MREGWEGSSGQALRDAGGRLGISLAFMLPQQGTPSEIERVFAAMEQQRPDAVLVSGEGDLYAHRRLCLRTHLVRRAGRAVSAPQSRPVVVNDAQK